MWSIFFRGDAEARTDCLIAELWACGTKGIIEEEAGIRAFFEDEVDVATILAIVEDHHGKARQEPEVTQSFLREGWDPILIGERFYVAPPWVTEAAPLARMRLEIDAATAFGTGRHETTQLCIEAMERILRPEHVVLDVGCGSGILSAAARMLGAHKIFSCDIQEDAVATSRQHVKTPVFQGSADAIGSATADLVLANISAAVLDTLAFDLERVIKPDGRLILSGFIHERVPEFYKPGEAYSRGDWLCWICKSEDVVARDGTSDSTGLMHKTEWWL